MTTAIQQQPAIAVASIVVSKTNPRKTFDKAKLDELAASIKLQGVLQPILVRPINGKGSFEVVAGERRFKATKLAGLQEIPAVVKELTDAEALELQVIENQQREDLHPLEEAEGYEALLKCKHPDGVPYSVKDIAGKVGKSGAYVYQKLKLCALCPEGRKAFFDGKLDFSRALLIARIGHHDTQRQALKEITEKRYNSEDGMSFREAQRHVQTHYMLALGTAPFDIKDVSLVAKAGACGPCPKRTGNQADLFGDVKSADVCTDPKCFDDKRQAHYAVAAKALEEKGKKVIYGEAAKKLFPNWESPNQWSREQLSGAYLRLSDTTYASGRSAKVAEVLGKDFEPTLVQHPGTGEIHKVATQQAVAAASQKGSKKRGTKDTAPKARKPIDAGPDIDDLVMQRTVEALHKKLPTIIGRPELELLCKEVLISAANCEIDAIFTAADCSTPAGGMWNLKELPPQLKKLDTRKLTVLTLELAILADLTEGKGAFAAAYFKRFKIDQAKIKKDIEAEIAGKKQAPAKAAAAKKPTAAPARKKAKK